MTGWDPFVALTLVLLLVLLVLSRLSQNALEEYAPPTGDEQSPAPSVEQVTVREQESTGSQQGAKRSAQEPADPSPSVPEDPSPPAPTDPSPSVPEDPSPPAPPTSVDGPPEEGEPQPPSPWAERPQAETPVLTPEVLMANVALTQGLVVVILGVAVWYFGVPAAALGITAEATSTGLPAVALGVVFGTVLWVANELSTAVADVVGAAYDERVREMLAPDSARGWVVLFGGVLPVIAVGEELLFRAALIGVPHAAYGVDVWLLALASSVAFALGHGAQGRVGVVVTGALGFVLAAGYVVTESLLMVVVAHYVINALEFLVHEFFDVEDTTADHLRGLLP